MVGQKPPQFANVKDNTAQTVPQAHHTNRAHAGAGISGPSPAIPDGSLTNPKTRQRLGTSGTASMAGSIKPFKHEHPRCCVGCRCVVVFITKEYIDKCNVEGEDNCKKEFLSVTLPIIPDLNTNPDFQMFKCLNV